MSCFRAFSLWQTILVIFCNLKKKRQNFNKINVSKKYRHSSTFKQKMSVFVSTLKNSVVKLFVATSVRRGCSRNGGTKCQNEWGRFTGSYRLPSKSVCFPPESRELNRESSVSAQLCLCGILSKVPVQLLDTVWAESAWKAIRSLSPSLPFN